MRLFVMIAVFTVVASSAFGNPSKVRRSASQGLPGEYIVVLQRDTPITAVEGIAQSLAKSYDLTLRTVWDHSLKGFLVSGSDTRVDAMAGDPRVRYVEQNVVMSSISATQSTWFDPNFNPCLPGNSNCEYLWHLDRLDELSWADRDGEYNMCTEGRNVVAYVIDWGVQGNHEQFESPSRVVEMRDFSDDRTNLGVISTVDATNGCTQLVPHAGRWHGTAVASVLGGTQVGAAKVQIVSLKVGDCATGDVTTDRLVSAIHWVNDSSPGGNGFRSQPGVINHSGFRPPWDMTISAYSDTVRSVVQQTNFPFFTSADNFSADACRFGPNEQAYTKFNKFDRTVFVVGGTSAGGDGTDRDFRFQGWVTELNEVTGLNELRPAIGQDSGSNGGACVSVYAPAASIYAARHSAYVENGVPKKYARANGTSFSSPIVAAIAARWIQRQITLTGVRPTYAQVYDWLLSQAQTPVYHTPTPEYYYCFSASHGTAPQAYRPGQQDETCPFNTIGVNGLVTHPGFYSPPFHFPSVGNSSDARMVFWDEAFGGKCY
jgi:hypothetical protein